MIGVGAGLLQRARRLLGAGASGIPANVQKAMGPMLSSASMTGINSSAAQYVSEFTAMADTQWTATGAGPYSAGSPSDNTNYYDRAWTMYAWYYMTGDSKYLTRAKAMVDAYRTGYLEPNGYAAIENWRFVWGLYLDWVLTGNAAARTAIGGIATRFTTAAWLADIGDTSTNVNAYGDNRMQAYVLRAVMAAKLCNAPAYDTPSFGTRNWDTLLPQIVTTILGTQSVNGSNPWGRVAYQNGGTKPFMVALRDMALIEYYHLFSADASIVTKIKESCDWLWTNAKGTLSQNSGYAGSFGTDEALLYLTGVAVNGTTPEGDTNLYSADLAAMSAHSYAWLYERGQGATYKTRAESLMKTMVDEGFISGQKQFNEAYGSTWRNYAWCNPGTGRISDFAAIAPTAPSNTVAPVASGNANVGSTLSVTTGTWSGSATITFAYQWRRSGVNISGATASTYLLVSGDLAANITCRVTATNGVGSATADSNTIGPIAAAATAGFSTTDKSADITVSGTNNLTADNTLASSSYNPRGVRLNTAFSGKKVVRWTPKATLGDIWMGVATASQALSRAQGAAWDTNTRALFVNAFTAEYRATQGSYAGEPPPGVVAGTVNTNIYMFVDMDNLRINFATWSGSALQWATGTSPATGFVLPSATFFGFAELANADADPKVEVVTQDDGVVTGAAMPSGFSWLT